jgi:hypothetical protein
MPQREFANQKALLAYAERNALVHAWERSPAFAKRQRLRSPKEYDIVEVRRSRGMSRAMLFSQAILAPRGPPGGGWNGPRLRASAGPQHRAAQPRAV